MPALKKADDVIRNIPLTSLLKTFNILYDEDGVPFVNIFRGYVLTDQARANQLIFRTYTSDDTDWWDTISFRQYSNPTLWWVVAIANDIINPFEELGPGQNVKVIKESYIYNIFDSATQMERL